MLLTGPGRSTISVDYPSEFPGAAILRRDLDQMLLDAAIAAGADFMPGAPVAMPLIDSAGRASGVRLQGRHGAVTAAIVVAADGRSSRLARFLGLSRTAPSPSRWAFGNYIGGVAGLTTRGEMHIRDDGYIGIAPLGNGIANVCVVRARGDVPPGSAPDATIADALSRDPVLADRCCRAVSVGLASVLGPLAVDSTAAGCPGLLLAGDAAGFIDPMTGDGLRFALRGGELAAQAALAELSTGRPAHVDLHATRHREFAAKWCFNRALRRLVCSPRGVRLAARAASYWPLPFEALVAIAGDLHLAEKGQRAHAA
jgi:flavin-dependent dehydrogenase